jgi:hypothetical protein
MNLLHHWRRFGKAASAATPIVSIIGALWMGMGLGFGWPAVYPTGTTFYNPEYASPGYILYSPVDQLQPDEIAAGMGHRPRPMLLIDMEGKIVHKWSVPFFPIEGRLLRNGNVIIMGITSKDANANRPGFGKFSDIGGGTGRLAELTWDGKTVFDHEDLNMHHDFVKLSNGHYVYIDWEPVPKSLQSKVLGGAAGSEFAGGIMFNDVLVEVDQQGKTVWTWHANDHLDPRIDIIGPIYSRKEWLHSNSVDLLPNGNLVMSCRSTDEIIIIKKSTGRIVFRWGHYAHLNPATGQLQFHGGYNSLGGPHDASVIPPGLKGAGHIMCYDNALYDQASRAMEIDPATGKLVWFSHQPGIGRKHFSNVLGSVQRLPNGNTLINDGANGRFFQITPLSQTVWEYVNPYVTQKQYQGCVFKIRQYAPGWCPQFASLSPAAGAAVVPPRNEKLRVPAEGAAGEQELDTSEGNASGDLAASDESEKERQKRIAAHHPDLIPLPIAIASVLVLGGVLMFLRARVTAKRR